MINTMILIYVDQNDDNKVCFAFFTFWSGVREIEHYQEPSHLLCDKWEKLPIKVDVTAETPPPLLLALHVSVSFPSGDSHAVR